jgi:hypothetical protein
MFRNTTKYSKRIAATVAVLALAAPASAAALPSEVVDHRSPDAVDAAIQAEQANRNYQHLQSLDERRQQAGYVDHRSPDASDSGFARSPAPLTIEESAGFDWGDAGIGAGALFGLLLIVLSLSFSVVHRRNRAATA